MEAKFLKVIFCLRKTPGAQYNPSSVGKGEEYHWILSQSGQPCGRDSNRRHPQQGSVLQRSERKLKTVISLKAASWDIMAIAGDNRAQRILISAVDADQQHVKVVITEDRQGWREEWCVHCATTGSTSLDSNENRTVSIQHKSASFLLGEGF
jgi:hypothetical protein